MSRNSVKITRTDSELAATSSPLERARSLHLPTKGEPCTAMALRLLTFNIWFSPHEMERRMQAGPQAVEHVEPFQPQMRPFLATPPAN